MESNSLETSQQSKLVRVLLGSNYLGFLVLAWVLSFLVLISLDSTVFLTTQGTVQWLYPVFMQLMLPNTDLLIYQLLAQLFDFAAIGVISFLVYRSLATEQSIRYFFSVLSGFVVCLVLANIVGIVLAALVSGGLAASISINVAMLVRLLALFVAVCVIPILYKRLFHTQALPIIFAITVGSTIVMVLLIAVTTLVVGFRYLAEAVVQLG